MPTRTVSFEPRPAELRLTRFEVELLTVRRARETGEQDVLPISGEFDHLPSSSAARARPRGGPGFCPGREVKLCQRALRNAVDNTVASYDQIASRAENVGPG